MNNTAGTRYRQQQVFMLLAVGTGLRRGELMALRQQDAEAVSIKGHDRYLLHVEGGKTVNAKRRVPVPHEMTSLVDELLGHNTTYLLHDGDPESQAQALGMRMRDTRTRAKTASDGNDWNGITAAHSFRRSYIQTLMKTGVDTLAAKVVLGHTTSDITFSLYGRNAVSTEALFEVVDAADWKRWIQE